MNCCIMITILILIIAIIYFIKSKFLSTNGALNGNFSAARMTSQRDLDMISQQDRQECANKQAIPKFVETCFNKRWASCENECIVGHAICKENAEICQGAMIKGSASCESEQACKEATIDGDAYCIGNKACKGAKITGNACCVSDDACQGAIISGTKTISNSDCLDQLKQWKESIKTQIEFGQKWEGLASYDCDNIDQRSQDCDAASSCYYHCFEATKNIKCTGERSCQLAYIRTTSNSYTIHCNGEKACKNAYIFGNVICEGIGSCERTRIYGNACCVGACNPNPMFIKNANPNPKAQIVSDAADCRF